MWGASFEAVEFGLLQTHDDWASFTASGREDASTPWTSLVVIVERNGPRRWTTNIDVQIGADASMKAPLATADVRIR